MSRVILIVIFISYMFKRHKIYMRCFATISLFLIFYKRETLVGMISKLYKIQGSNIIKAITNGNSIVQQNDIN